ncbi:MAG: hypothetical protein HY889_10020 [Deltaproteobacteria bacterium]|nr:hypothetical protein [Deltaproteobacteria bacterium]
MRRTEKTGLSLRGLGNRLIPALTLSLVLFGLSSPGYAFLDPDSAQCLGCHDAAIAKDVTLQVCSLPDCDHPLGVDYALAASTNKGLRQPVNLNPSITLVNNSVGCTTCHVPYSVADHTILTAMRRTVYPASPDPMLVMDNRRSELCLGCHLK